MYDLTVLIVTYNSDLEKLKKTIKMSVEQKSISIQIVIADDGSKNNYFEEIRRYFSELQFNDFILVENEENKGTVKNILSGLSVSKGRYIKTISPGDYFDNERVMCEWIYQIEKSNRRWSFCDAIYYSNKDSNKIYTKYHNPIDLKPYIAGNDKQCMWNYNVLRDYILGATIICEKKLFDNYLKEIDNKVKYCEDCIYRLMIFDGNLPYYFSQKAIWYEYGDGISTGGNNKWMEALHKDTIATDNIILKRKNNSRYQDRIVEKIKLDQQKNLKNKFKKIFIKGKIVHKIRRWLMWH